MTERRRRRGRGDGSEGEGMDEVQLLAPRKDAGKVGEEEGLGDVVVEAYCCSHIPVALQDVRRHRCNVGPVSYRQRRTDPKRDK